MTHADPTPPFVDEIDLLLRASHGKPFIHIVLDPKHDSTSVRGVGIDNTLIPRIILDLGRALTNER